MVALAAGCVVRALQYPNAQARLLRTTLGRRFPWSCCARLNFAHAPLSLLAGDLGATSSRWRTVYASSPNRPLNAQQLRLSSSIVTQAVPDKLKGVLQTPAQYATGSTLLDSIVKVYTVHSRPNYFMPWQNHPKRESTGTGFVINDRLIITNAHVVADSTYVLVKRHGSGSKYRADVEAVGHDCDLAILSVREEEFWHEPTPMLPLELGDLPALQDNVVVVGYPTGGDNTSITSGVVSRVEVARYVHGAAHLMAIQIDAAINPGNSGGPALQDSCVVGVAFQNLPTADNIGYIIPTSVVRQFLTEVARHGYYKGHCALGVMCQSLENSSLREALLMGPGMTGVLINHVEATAPAAKVVRKNDVLLEFDGVPLANDGTVPLRHRERIFFSSLVTLKETGDDCLVKVLRDGQVLELKLQVGPVPPVVPVHQYDTMPSYLVFGGLVFVPLTQPYLQEYGDDWVNACPRRLYDKAIYTQAQYKGQQIVIVSQVLTDDVNTGYNGFNSLQVLKVDGTPVQHLRHLKQLIEEGTGRFVRFELEDNRMLAIDRSLADARATKIADRYRVPTLVSPDMMEPSTPSVPNTPSSTVKAEPLAAAAIS